MNSSRANLCVAARLLDGMHAASTSRNRRTVCVCLGRPYLKVHDNEAIILSPFCAVPSAHRSGSLLGPPISLGATGMGPPVVARGCHRTIGSMTLRGLPPASILHGVLPALQHSALTSVDSDNRAALRLMTGARLG